MKENQRGVGHLNGGSAKAPPTLRRSIWGGFFPTVKKGGCPLRVCRPARNGAIDFLLFDVFFDVHSPAVLYILEKL